MCIDLLNAGTVSVNSQQFVCTMETSYLR